MTQVGVTIEETGEIEQLLGRLEVQMRRKIAKQAVRAGAKVVQKRARQLCPRSAATGSRRGWSKKTRSARRGRKPLAQTIKVAVRDYDDTFMAITGPEYPAGALSHLIEFRVGGKVPAKVLWGQATGEPRRERPFMRPAADETKGEQEAAIVDTVRRGVQQAGG